MENSEHDRQYNADRDLMSRYMDMQERHADTQERYVDAMQSFSTQMGSMSSDIKYLKESFAAQSSYLERITKLETRLDGMTSGGRDNKEETWRWIGTIAIVVIGIANIIVTMWMKK